jgi:hypothetical protein
MAWIDPWSEHEYLRIMGGADLGRIAGRDDGCEQGHESDQPADPGGPYVGARGVTMHRAAMRNHRRRIRREVLARVMWGLGLACATSTLLLIGAHRAGASAWAVQRTARPPDSKGYVFAGVSCTTRRDCTIVGWFDTRGRGTASRLLIEHWDGSRWSIRRTPLPIGSRDSMLSGVSCRTSAACTAVGSFD